MAHFADEVLFSCLKSRSPKMPARALPDCRCRLSTMPQFNNKINAHTGKFPPVRSLVSSTQLPAPVRWCGAAVCRRVILQALGIAKAKAQQKLLAVEASTMKKAGDHASRGSPLGSPLGGFCLPRLRAKGVPRGVISGGWKLSCGGGGRLAVCVFFSSS